MAMKRRIEKDGESDMGRNSSSDRERKRSKKVEKLKMDEELSVMIEEARSCQEVEKERVRSDERRIKMEGKMVKRINTREKKRISLEKKSIELVKRRVAIQEKGLELEKEEKKPAHREEKSSMDTHLNFLTVLERLAKKLG